MSEVAATAAPVAEPAPVAAEPVATEEAAPEKGTVDVVTKDKKSLVAKLKAIIKRVLSKKEKPAAAPAAAEPTEPAPAAATATPAAA